MKRSKGALTRYVTHKGWHVMWTLEGTRLVHAISGPFDTKKEAQSYAREMSKVLKSASGDSTEGTYYLSKSEGVQS